MSLPNCPLGFYPTPLHPLDALSKRVGGARIWVKRDDQTGLALGGSKTRALGMLMGDALAKGADTIVTCGPTTSNHVRLTAAAAKRLGLGVVLVLRGDGKGAAQGNMLLNHILGAKLRFADVTSLADLDKVMVQTAEELQEQGRTPYIVPGGGYSPIGALGYRELVRELRDQSTAAGFAIDAVVFASGSGCIQSGLIAGSILEGMDVPIFGVTINRSASELHTRIEHDVAQALDLANAPGRRQSHIRVIKNHLGPGYALPSDAGMAAITLTARTEGLLLDPCYTGKSMAATLELSQDEFGKGHNIIFIHTGGTPGIFNYANDLIV